MLRQTDEAILGAGAGVERLTEPGAGSVNSYMVRAQAGIVLIDAQRVLSQGRAVAAHIAATGEPLLAILLTHPHPDHFGGLAGVLETFPNAPVYASEATREEIRTDGAGYIAATRRVAPDDTPETFPLPTETFEHGDALTFGGVRFVVDEIGPGEAASMSMFHLPQRNLLVAGDLVAFQMTAFLLENRIAAWRAQIEAARARYGSDAPTLLPGHGAPGAFAAHLDWQRDYLAAIADLAAPIAAGGAASEAQIADAAAKMQARYPDHPPVAAIPDLLALNFRVLAGAA